MPDTQEEQKKMSPGEIEHLIEEAVGKGAIEVLYHFDAHGAQKEAVENAMVDMIARASKEHGILFCAGEIEQAIENAGLYSCAAQVRIVATDFNVLVNLALKYGPIAVEIQKPDRLSLDLETAHSCLLDVSQASQDFASFVYEKMLSGEDKEKYNAQLAARVKLGEMLRSGKKEGTDSEEKK